MRTHVQENQSPGGWKFQDAFLQCRDSGSQKTTYPPALREVKISEMKDAFHLEMVHTVCFRGTEGRLSEHHFRGLKHGGTLCSPTQYGLFDKKGAQGQGFY